MRHSAEMVRCLESGDISAARKLWAYVAPHYPQPQDDKQALIIMHMARTQSRQVAFKARAYSHRWLTDEGYPSQLPDRLRPKAERLYPKVAEGVGFAVISKSEIAMAIKPHVVKAVNEAIVECYDSKKTEPGFVKARMFEARNYVVKKLLGRLLLTPNLQKE